MAKMTVLEIVQNILSALEGDEVNSIGDTVQSLQVAEVVKETYYDLFSNKVIPTFEGLIKLESRSDLTSPTCIRIPGTVKEIYWIKYNWHDFSATDFRDVEFIDPRSFIDYSFQLQGQTATTTAVGPNGTTLIIGTQTPPRLWTTFDNNDIYFDSYDSSIESTVENTNTMCFGQYEQDFQLTDLFVPMLDTNLFPLLLAESKAVCFVNQKQVSSQKEEQRSHRLQVTSQNDRWRANQRDYQGNEPNYGRMGPAPRRVPKTTTRR